MNTREYDILKLLAASGYENQRILAKISGHSLGMVNRSIKSLSDSGFIDSDMQVTEQGRELIRSRSPQNAIILAAGFGMRMVPINTMYTKGMLQVEGEPLAERLIKQLRQAGIEKIYIVVGFMKEEYEYLIDKYGVKLIVNKSYADKNNLYSLKTAEKYIGNSYIIPCDIWCRNDPFSNIELYSWYMVSDRADGDSSVRVNRKMELTAVEDGEAGNSMVGIAYISSEDADALKKRLGEMCASDRNSDCFWEAALMSGGKMNVPARVVSSEDYVEINTYEQLRELDDKSGQLRSDAIELISKALGAAENEITDITTLKKGMTNRSFLFKCKGGRYIMRIPGEGTDKLIRRGEEAEVYELIKDRGICDEIVYISPENGYKITRFMENGRVCDPENTRDLERCMAKLRQFHGMKLKVGHRFDIFSRIDFYESLWQHKKSLYKDYEKTKSSIMRLKEYIDKQPREECLTHIDAVPDNFLFSGDEVYLIDWEYAAMQDPHVDVAMFIIYALYDREQADRLIDIYFEDKCSEAVRTKIYCYIAACGLLWSNWCEYKLDLGVEFGEYSICQYRFAKDFYKLAAERIWGGDEK